jgi:exopolysaccharide biosynthesis protein
MCRRRLILLLTLLCAPLSRAEFPTTNPYQAIEYHHELLANPVESIYIVTVDLTDPRVSIRISPAGPDPDGPGPWETTLMPVRDIAAREHFDIAINASFFAVNRSNLAEEKAETSGIAATTLPSQKIGYIAGAWAKDIGWSMTDGKLWSSPSNNWPIFYITADNAAKIDQPEKIPSDARQIVAGNCLLLKNGQPAAPFAGAMAVRHPRTAIGLNRAGTKLVLLTIDGRRPLSAWGMTGPELADEMQKLNCWTALNLDGGGSTTLIMRDPQTSELKLLNQPSDNRERPVGDAIGITIRADGAK